MKMDQQLNGCDVLMTCKETDVSTLVLVQRETNHGMEYIIGSTRDGKTWNYGQYFHVADYGAKADAYAAAHLQFCYRSGLTATINRAAKSHRPNVKQLLADLRIVPDRREARMRSYSE